MSATTRQAEPLIETLPLEERIRQRANEIYAEHVQRGNPSGSQLDDWLQAEELLPRTRPIVPGEWAISD